MTLRIDGAAVPQLPSALESAPADPTPSAPADGPSAFSRVLSNLGQAVDQGEGMISGVASGQWSGSDPGTLIALQAGIYRYSEAVDLVGKLVDRAGNGVRTVLQSGH